MKVAHLILLVLISGCIGEGLQPAALCAPFTDSDQRDYCLTNLALSNGSMEACQLIAKPDLQAGCIAGLSGNITLCQNVTDKHWKDLCIYNVAQKGGRIWYCQGISDINIRSGCLRDSGQPTHDYSFCNGMGNYNEALWCYATSDRDLLACGKINDTFWRGKCVEDINNQANPTTTTLNVEKTTTTTLRNEASTTTLPEESSTTTLGQIPSTTLASAPVNLAECETRQSPIEKDWCISSVGIQTKNPKTCELVGNIYWREACYRDVATVTSDPSLCEKMGEGKRRDTCYLQVSFSSGNKTLCDDIEDNVFWNLCQAHNTTKAF
jgi:hypothetical protein